MPAKTRILIVTDSAALPSGLAETTRLIFGNLLDQYPGAYELHQIGLFHCYAVTTPRWPVYPTATLKERDGKLNFVADDRFGQKTFFRLLPQIQPDLVFVFGDPYRARPFCLPPDKRKYALVLYVNFDGMPLPPGHATGLDQADMILAKSEFSMNVLAHALPESAKGKLGYLYSPADTQRFKPISETEKAEYRRELFPSWMPPDAFVLGWVGRNQWRKQVWLLYKVLHYLRSGEYLVCDQCERVSLFDWDPMRQQHLKGSSETLESRPGYTFDRCACCGSLKVSQAAPLRDVFLWLHMAEEPEEGWPLPWLEQQWGLRRDRDLYYTPEHGLKSALDPADVPTLYRLWDGMLYLSGGEGFGLPAWEAMCSALPLVYTKYSAHGEFVSRANAGFPVSGILQPEQSCIWRMVADVPQVIQAVRRLYQDRALGKQLGLNGRRFVEQYTPEIQVPKWHELFQRVLIQRRLRATPGPPPGP
jgi:glycosyltransferase involved in cell wall biosynthesis